eukprot:COSAG01_NODE_1288_length_10887_cov_324.284761_7_plen_238_part_00
MILKKPFKSDIKCIYQQEHANLAEKLLQALKIKTSPYKPLIIACKYHDWGWQNADQKPSINPKTKHPYSFLDIPTDQHIQIWQQSNNFVLEKDLIAGYLCHNHTLYLATTFEQHKEKAGPKLQKFIQQTTEQIKALKTQINIAPSTLQDMQHILRFCDELSLRMCMGSQKTALLSLPKQRLTLSSHAPDHYKLSPYPFTKKLSLDVTYHVFKNNKVETNQREKYLLEISRSLSKASP